MGVAEVRPPDAVAVTFDDVHLVANAGLMQTATAEALVQDRPIVLFHLACARLYQLRLVRPGLTVIEQSLVGPARETARRETARRVAPLLTPELCRRLDRLLEGDTDGATAKATWLRHFPVAATPGVMADEMDKLV